jgi:hypothetical protein
LLFLPCHNKLEAVQQAFDISITLPHIPAPGKDEVTSPNSLDHSQYIARITRAINYSGAADIKSPAFTASQPRLVNQFGAKLADSVWSRRARQAAFGRRLVKRTVNSNGAGEKDVSATNLFRECTGVLRVRYVRLKILLRGVPGFPMHCGEIEQPFRLQTIELKRLPHIAFDKLTMTGKRLWRGADIG